MKYLLGVFAVGSLNANSAPSQAPCAKPPAGTETRFFIEPVTVASRDTVISARLCVVPGAKGLGSYMATLTYASSRFNVVSVETTGGMQAANSRTPGVIRIAGASANGFSAGPLATIRFSRRGSSMAVPVTLSVTEASTVTGASLAGETIAVGWPAGVIAPVQRPSIDSISPRSGEVGPDRVTDIIIYGKGFAPSGNTVVFAGADVTGLLSEQNGTILRFGAPSHVPGRNGAGTRRIESGSVEVRVKHRGGTSNAVTFIVKEDDR